MSSPSSPLPGSERADYRGKCRYKTGKCTNERALKTSGAAHNLCDDHRNKQNQHQRKLDAKNRQHKRERRVSSTDAKSERFSPYPVTSTRQSDSDASPALGSRVHDEMPVDAPPTATASSSSSASSSCASSSTQPPVVAATSSGVMYLPNGPQPPQLSYPFVVQDFDGIVVPLPSYLEGQERIEFRSRIYQKVLDFISEECIERFGAKEGSLAVVEAAAHNGSDTEAEAEDNSHPSRSEGDHDNAAVTEDSRATKKVH